MMLPKCITILIFMIILRLGCSKSIVFRAAGDESTRAMCRLPAYKGHCRALLPRWRYSPHSGKCQEFIYGGCDGNGNNFNSYKQCMAVCWGA